MKKYFFKFLSAVFITLIFVSCDFIFGFKGTNKGEEEYKDIEYTVTIDYGNNQHSETFTEKENAVITEKWLNQYYYPGTKTGYTFEGWYVGDVRVGDGYTVTSDITIKARWKKILKKCTISFDLNDGTSITTLEADEDTILTSEQLGAPTKTGYLFEGWYSEEIKIDAGYTVTSDINLTAKWKAITYTISFDANGGDGEIENMTATYDEDVTLPKNTFTVQPRKKQKGWMTTATESEETKYYQDNESVSNLSETDGDTVVFYARYVDLVTITFVTDHGVLEPSTVEMEKGSAIFAEDLSAPGWKFEGWYNGEDLVTAAENDMVLTAKWTELVQTIKFSANDNKIVDISYQDPSVSSRGIYEQTFKGSDIDFHFDKVKFASANYNFVGWTLMPNGGGGEIFPDGHEFAWEPALTYSETVYLYAKWEAKKGVGFDITLPTSNAGYDLMLEYDSEKCLLLISTYLGIDGDFVVTIDDDDAKTHTFTPVIKTNPQGTNYKAAEFPLRTLYSEYGMDSGIHSIMVTATISADIVYSKTAVVIINK